MPMCRPDRASRCAPPLSRNTRTVSRGSPLRSPVRSAFSRGAVPAEGKGIRSMNARSRSPQADVHRPRKVADCAPGNAAVHAQKAPSRTKTGNSRDERSVRRMMAASEARTRRMPLEQRTGSAGRRRSSVPAATPAVKWIANASMFSRLAISFLLLCENREKFTNFAKITRKLIKDLYL